MATPLRTDRRFPNNCCPGSRGLATPAMALPGHLAGGPGHLWSKPGGRGRGSRSSRAKRGGSLGERVHPHLEAAAAPAARYLGKAGKEDPEPLTKSTLPRVGRDGGGRSTSVRQVRASSLFFKKWKGRRRLPSSGLTSPPNSEGHSGRVARTRRRPRRPLPPRPDPLPRRPRGGQPVPHAREGRPGRADARPLGAPRDTSTAPRPRHSLGSRRATHSGGGPGPTRALGRGLHLVSATQPPPQPRRR